MTKIKICGLKRKEDILAVNHSMPDYCGFIIHFPKSHRNLSEEQVRELKKDLNPKIRAVGVYVNPEMEEAERLLLDGTLDIVQLHGQESDAFVKELKMRTGKPVIKAFKIRSQEDVKNALQSSADMILLDQGYGTGETFDWSLVPKISRPWILAGGLREENLDEAIRRLKPDAVDLSSSVETDKWKDPDKIERAVEIVRRYK